MSGFFGTLEAETRRKLELENGPSKPNRGISSQAGEVY